MKNTIFKKSGAAALALAVAVAVSGCAQKAQLSGKIVDDETMATITPSEPVSAGEVEVSEAPAVVVDERETDNLLRRRSVYFDFDKSAVDSSYLQMIRAHAEYLLRNGGKGALLEGNADSRGSNEYNLALGQRRADAVRDLMLSGGVPEAQLESLSFGEEKPRQLGNSEAAWAENRRVDIRYRDE